MSSLQRQVANLEAHIGKVRDSDSLSKNPVTNNKKKKLYEIITLKHKWIKSGGIVHVVNVIDRGMGRGAAHVDPMVHL